MSDEIRARLWNWGIWARGGLPALEGRNSIWGSPARLPVRIDVDDAERVEFVITSLSQPTKARPWRKYAFMLKLFYCEGGMLKDKVKDYNARWRVSISERTFTRRLRDAEGYVEGLITTGFVPLKVLNSSRLRV